jgi:TetR/AcrR family tetracycline transcriptional repressor
LTLDRSILIDAGLKLLDEVGLEGLTLRRLAASLGVQAPALYWHFKNKQELLDQMATAVLVAATRENPPNPRAKWDKWATNYARGLRTILLRYRDGARMVSGTQVTDNSLYVAMEVSLRILVDAGFTLYMSTVVMSTLYSYVVGFVIEEQAVHPRPDEFVEIYDPKKRAERMNSDKLPLAQKAGEYLFQNFDRRFEAGLRAIIEGMAQRKTPKAKR